MGTSVTKGSHDYLALGDWDAMCAYCGRKRKASEMKRDGEFAMGLYCCPEHADIRHPQDFVRAIKDDMHVPWAQPPAVVFTSFDANFPVTPSPPELDSVTMEGSTGVFGTVIAQTPSWVIPTAYAWSWQSGGSGINIENSTTLAALFEAPDYEGGLSGVATCLVTDSLGGQSSCTVPVNSPPLLTGTIAGDGDYNTASLSWVAATDAGISTITGYNIYQGSSLIASVDAATLSYDVDDLADDTTFVFSIVPVTVEGELAASNPLSLTSGGPQVPAGLAASTNLAGTQITWTWDAASTTGGSITGYKIYDAVSGDLLATVDAEEYQEDSTPGDTYSREVSAITTTAESGKSPPVDITPEATAWVYQGTITSNVGVALATDGSGTIYSLDSSKNIYKSTNGGVSWTSVGTAPTAVGGLAVSGSTLIVCSEVAYYISTDGGGTWSSAIAPSPDTYGTTIPVTNGSGTWFGGAYEQTQYVNITDEPSTSWTGYGPLSDVDYNPDVQPQFVGPVWDGSNVYFIATDSSGDNAAIVEMDGMTSTVSVVTSVGPNQIVPFGYGYGVYYCVYDGDTAGDIRLADTAAGLADATPVATGLLGITAVAVGGSSDVIAALYYESPNTESAVTENGGASWTSLSCKLQTDEQIRSLVYDPSSGNFIAYGSKGGVSTLTV